jgi:deazaflavin-dependent oxidoreductase (nitroreductase family)
VSDYNAQNIEEFRANHGKVGGYFEGKPVLLLHHKGARSGIERVNPLMYQKVNGGYAVFASKGGAPHSPGWYYNLRANPNASIEIGDGDVAVTARVADRDGRAPIWERQKREFPQFAGYERRTRRTIPVVILERAA